MDILPCSSQSDQVAQSAQITRRELFDVLKNEKFFKFSLPRCNERLFLYILEKLRVKICSPLQEKTIKTSIKVFITKLVLKWKTSHHIFAQFVTKNAEWLDKEFQLPQLNELPQTTPTRKSSPGRPKKEFAASSLRTKQRNVQTIVNQMSSEQLTLAATSSLVKSGRRATANVVKLALEASPQTLRKMRQASRKEDVFTRYSPEEALALIVDTSLSKENYIKIQRGAKTRGANLYPAYNVVREVKKTCYPKNIVVTEIEACIPLQDLLDKTADRLFEVQRDVISQHLHADTKLVTVYYKWGLDGSGGHIIYKQAFQNHPKYSDSNIILSTIVPLEISVNQGGEKCIFWKNFSPSSTKYCRPISFKLIKESNTSIKEQHDEIEQQIQRLHVTNVELNTQKTLKFEHKLLCTMMDGKTCNVLTETSSSQACNICKITPKDINDLEKVKKRVSDISAYKFGISILHSYLRSFEYLLHIAYKMETQQWQTRGNEAKAKVKEQKQNIQTQFYEKIGLVVDQPKQGGGNTNDGNTARKFFDNPDKAAEITGLDAELIKRFANILSAISSCHYIQVETFKIYCLDTAKLCINLYGWYKMSASVHKLLIHSGDIIAFQPLPIGQLSEDVLEASQKDYKNIRLFHSRKISRIDKNTDIIHWMLINSDPVISSFRQKRKKHTKQFNQNVLTMITLPQLMANTTEDRENYTDISDNDNTDSD